MVPGELSIGGGIARPVEVRLKVPGVRVARAQSMNRSRASSRSLRLVVESMPEPVDDG